MILFVLIFQTNCAYCIYRFIMSLLSTRNQKIVVAIAIALAGILFEDELKSLYRRFSGTKTDRKVGIFTEEELSQFNGIQQKKLYLSILGSIFDVTKGKKHYAKDGSYHYFVGKDGSRAFITGHFRDESFGKDHVLDLPCDDIFGLLGWLDTFKQKYKPVGVLIGRYYDEAGEPTEYSKQLQERIQHCEEEKEIAKQEVEKYPPCNMEWSEDQGSRVWCTKNSGGITRGWAGVPRQFYTPGDDNPRCVCINLHKDNSHALLKAYDGCEPNASSCIIKN